jgi:hypothetical protein
VPIAPIADDGVDTCHRGIAMTISTFTAGSAPASGTIGAYVPGVCNIGPAEIARRRRAGHVGLLAAIGLLAALILVDAPPLARLLVILPATISASGYLQAWLKFCAGLGSRGLFNFGPLGTATAVTDRDALERDRRRSRQIGLMSFGIGILAGVIAVLLPF